MNFTENEVYHIYNRGNNSQKIFYDRDNYLYFLKLVQKFFFPYCNILARALMPNHFHFMIHANEKSVRYLPNKQIPLQQLSESVRLLLSNYTKAINHRYNLKGSLFQQKTKSKNLYDGKMNYAEQAFNYIHQNPVKAGLCDEMHDWEFSSYRDYAGLRNGKLCNKDLAVRLLNVPIENFDAYSKSFAEINLINTGLIM